MLLNIILLNHREFNYTGYGFLLYIEGEFKSRWFIRVKVELFSVFAYGYKEQTNLIEWRDVIIYVIKDALNRLRRYAIVNRDFTRLTNTR